MMFRFSLAKVGSFDGVIAANSKNRIGTASKKTLQAGVTAVRRRKR